MPPQGPRGHVCPLGRREPGWGAQGNEPVALLAQTAPGAAVGRTGIGAPGPSGSHRRPSESQGQTATSSQLPTRRRQAQLWGPGMAAQESSWTPSLPPKEGQVEAGLGGEHSLLTPAVLG